MDPWLALAIVAATLVATEALAWAVHRWVMHGIGWRWHRSHHEPEPGCVLETNDAYSAIASVAVTALFVASGGPSSPWWWVGLGATLYGVLYAVVHDGWAHGRWRACESPPESQRVAEARQAARSTRGPLAERGRGVGAPTLEGPMAHPSGHGLPTLAAASPPRLRR